MEKLTERVVDILRRCGPGVLPVRALRAELLRHRPAVAVSPDKLRLLVQRSGHRLRMLGVALDAIDPGQRGAQLGSWVVLTAPEDAPDSSVLAYSLWQSLAALALEVDVTSRVQVCRWAIKAEEARRIVSP